MPLAQHPLKQSAFGQRIFTDDKERRRDLLRLQNVEDLWRPARIGPVVKGQSNEAGPVPSSGDGIGPRNSQEIDVREQPVPSQ